MFKTVMGALVAPIGTNTVKLVALAAVTIALVAPKNTILLEAVLLKLVPVIVTVAPTAPEEGLKEVMVGGAASTCLKPIKTNRNRNSTRMPCVKVVFAMFCMLLLFCGKHIPTLHDHSNRIRHISNRKRHI